MEKGELQNQLSWRVILITDWKPVCNWLLQQHISTVLRLYSSRWEHRTGGTAWVEGAQPRAASASSS